MSFIDDHEARRKTRIAAAYMALGKQERHHVIDCDECGTHNRVDAARVIALRVVPLCGKCKAPLLRPGEMPPA